MRRLHLLTLGFLACLLLWACAGWGKDPAFVIYPQYYADKVYANQPPTLEQAAQWAAGRKLETFAAQGEFAPLSVVIYPQNGVKGVIAAASDLKSDAGKVIPASALQLYWVKNWYRPIGSNVKYDINARYLAPELLVKDASWLIVDDTKRRNELAGGWDALPNDAATLQPVDVPKGSVQQLWITVKVPDDAVAGVYKGMVTVTAGGEKVDTQISLEVFGWPLMPSAKNISLYTGERGGLPEDQHRAQDRDMRDHGLTVGYMYESTADAPDYTNHTLGKLPEVFKLYGDSGLLNDEMVLLDNTNTGIGVWNENPDDTFIADGRNKSRELLAMMRQYGYKGDVYVYGCDEWGGKMLAQAAKTYRGIAEGGAKVYVACGDDYYRYAGDTLKLPIMGISGANLTERAIADTARTHADGNDVWSYGLFTTIPEPTTLRYRLGFWQWTAPIDGTCLWAYMDNTGPKAYEEFPEKSDSDWMNSMLAYPTAHGVVDTIEFEGFREGVDDMRYATTLLCMVLKADKLGIKDPQIEAARKLAVNIQVADEKQVAQTPPTRWAGVLDMNRFDAKRREIADAITQLRAKFPQLALAPTTLTTGPVKEVRDYLKTTYPKLTGTFPYGVAGFAEGFKQFQDEMQQKRWYQAIQTGWQVIHLMDSARAANKITAAQYGVLIESFTDDFFDAELAFVQRTKNEDGTFTPSPIAGVYDQILDMGKLDWQIKPDFKNVGLPEKWFAPDLKMTDWRKVDVSQWWQLQGKGNEDLIDLDGVGWYRVTFTLPEAVKGRRVFLYIGGADEWCSVWVNGKDVGTHPGYGDAWARPFQLEMTDAVKPGDNVLAIRIYNTAQAGGLWSGLQMLGKDWQGVKLLALKE